VHRAAERAQDARRRRTGDAVARIDRDRDRPSVAMRRRNCWIASPWIARPATTILKPLSFFGLWLPVTWMPLVQRCAPRVAAT